MSSLGELIEKSEDQKISRRLVKLGRMQGHSERHLSRFLTAEIDGPGQMAFLAPATARRETAQPADRMAERNSGRERIEGQRQRQLLTPDVEQGDQHGHQQSTMKDPGSLQRAERENLLRVVSVKVPIE